MLEALGEPAGAAKDGLLALSIGVGLGFLHELMEAEVDEVVGPKGRHAVRVRGSRRTLRRNSGRRARRSARRGRALENGFALVVIAVTSVLVVTDPITHDAERAAAAALSFADLARAPTLRASRA